MTMTKAEFKTMRESLGLTPELVADKIGKHQNIIWRIESPGYSAKVSPEAAKALRGLAVDFDMAAERIAELSRTDGVIERPADRLGFDALVPELANWPDRAIGLFFAEVQRRTTMPIDYTKG